MDDTDTEEGGKFVDHLSEELIIPQSMNGMLASKEAKGQYQPADHVAINNMPTNRNHKSVLKSFAGQQQTVKRCEWIEMAVRRDQDGNHTEEEEKIVESQLTNERNHKAQSVPNLNFVIPLRYNTTRPHSLLIDGLPDVDYPTNNDSTLQPPYQPTMSREGPEFQRLPGRGGISSLTNSQSIDHDTRRNSSCSQSVDEETSPEPSGFSKDLRSPRLHRRRPIIHKGSFPHSVQRSVESWAVSNNSSSNSDSDYSLNLKRNSFPSSQSSDSPRVFKLGSLKPNQGMFWHMNDRVSPDPQTLSDPELADPNYMKVMKTQRSASIPNIIIEGEHGFHLHHSRAYTLPQEQDTAFHISERYPNGQNSPLAGLLERAKERVKDRDAIKRGRDVKMANLWSRHLSPSPTISTTPSPLPSDGDRDTDWEEEVKLMRHRAPTVSKGWKEQLVDGDENDNESRYV